MTTSTTFRHRHDGWTPVRQQRFLKVLAETGCVADACRAVGLTTTSAYRAKAKMPAFAAGWALALESVAPVLFATAYERAVEGWDEPVWWAGKQVGVRRRYAHDLLRLLIERGNRSDRRRPLSDAQRVAAAHEAAQAAGGSFLTERASEAETNDAILAALARIDARARTAADKPLGLADEAERAADLAGDDDDALEPNP